MRCGARSIWAMYRDFPTTGNSGIYYVNANASVVATIEPGGWPTDWDDDGDGDGAAPVREPRRPRPSAGGAAVAIRM
jgi:hypothetical protein